MTEMFSTLGTWNWLIFGLILMALELLAPGVFLFWLGLAALLVGLLSFAINPSWQLQILMFAIFAACAVPLWRHVARSNCVITSSTAALSGSAFAMYLPSSARSSTRTGTPFTPTIRAVNSALLPCEIGRASCRERV